MAKETGDIKEIKPVLTRYIGNSIILLEEEPVPCDRAIHDVRVLMKKARAALKLLAGQPAMEYTGRNLEDLREVGRKMRKWREDCVHRRTLRGLKKEFPSLFERLAGIEHVTRLLNIRNELSQGSENIKYEIREVVTLLKKTGYRIRFLTMDKPDHAKLFRELEASYERVVDRYLTCRNSRKPEDIHEFRKSTKDLLYQVTFFRPLNPVHVRTFERRVDAITDGLGRYNDLAQLVTALGYKYSNGRNPPTLDELVLRIREKQDRYLEKTWPRAFRMFNPGQDIAGLLGFYIKM